MQNRSLGRESPPSVMVPRVRCQVQASVLASVCHIGRQALLWIKSLQSVYTQETLLDTMV